MPLFAPMATIRPGECDRLLNANSPIRLLFFLVVVLSLLMPNDCESTMTESKIKPDRMRARDCMYVREKERQREVK